MQFPTVTAIYAAILALILVALSGWVIAGRWKYKVNLGEGGEQLRARVRAHANFAEYIPLILLLVALLEMAHTSRLVIHALLLPLVLARLVHPLGLSTPPASSRQFAFRGVPIILTLLVLAIAALLLLLRQI